MRLKPTEIKIGDQELSNNVFISTRRPPGKNPCLRLTKLTVGICHYLVQCASLRVAAGSLVRDCPRLSICPATTVIQAHSFHFIFMRTNRCGGVRLRGCVTVWTSRVLLNVTAEKLRCSRHTPPTMVLSTPVGCKRRQRKVNEWSEHQ